MQVHNVQQGTPEWHALRSSYFTASEAPAMMGASKYQTRNDLLAMKKTGIVEEVTPQQQAIFDRGHATEELARPLVEEMLGEELYPIVGTSGNLLASMDGATMLGDTLFEHKLWNQKVVAQIHAGELEPHYYWQLEQQLLVSGAERVIFVCSDGTRDNFAHLEYRPVAGRREQLVAGWAQFEEDLGAFEVKEAKVEVIGAAPDQLPALRIEVTGMVTASNLDAFKSHALEVFSNINTELKTDQDFADAEKTVKWCSEVEDKLKAAKELFFFQAEDGIRDAQESRGLGDVYKRQIERRVAGSARRSGRSRPAPLRRATGALPSYPAVRPDRLHAALVFDFFHFHSYRDPARSPTP